MISKTCCAAVPQRIVSVAEGPTADRRHSAIPFFVSFALRFGVEKSVKYLQWYFVGRRLYNCLLLILLLKMHFEH